MIILTRAGSLMINETDNLHANWILLNYKVTRTSEYTEKSEIQKNIVTMKM